jgi:hypothetical protein
MVFNSARDGIPSCVEAIQLAYKTLVILLGYPHVSDIFYAYRGTEIFLPSENLESHHIFNLIGFYGTPTQVRSCGAETGKMILTSSGCKKIKATPEVKTI